MNVDDYENLDLHSDDYKFLAFIKLSLNRALLGEVIPGLRAVHFVWKPGDETAMLLFYHDGPVTDGIICHYSSIMTEVCGDDLYYHGESIGFDHDVIGLDYPEPLPKKGYVAVGYLRKEPFINPE